MYVFVYICVYVCIIIYTKEQYSTVLSSYNSYFSTLFFYVLLTIRHNGFLWFMLQHRNKKRSKKIPNIIFVCFFSSFYSCMRSPPKYLYMFRGYFLPFPLLFPLLYPPFLWLWRESSARVFKQQKKRKKAMAQKGADP